MTDTTRVAFIGLGVMGYPMAGHLATSGYATCVYNRSPGKTTQWLEEYDSQSPSAHTAEAGVTLEVESAATPKAAARDRDLVFLCVGNDDDVRSVVYGDEGVFSSMASGSILVDHTTASAELAKELARESGKRGMGFLDAPVSGGQAGAQQGTLTIMVGGDELVFQHALKVMQSYARSVKLLGPAGSGQFAKMVNQICIAGVLQGLAEAIHFAQRADLDVDAVVDVISKGAAQSWQMENRAHTMSEGEFEFGFAVDWMRKDLAIALEAARKNGASLPLTALVDQMYAEVQAMGGGRWDTSSLIRRLTETQAG